MTLSNRDRRNGLILSNSYRTSQQKSYGKFNKKKARYNLNDLVLDINNDKTSSSSAGGTNDFDISNDSFRMTDDEDDVQGGLMINSSSDDDFGDEPYSNAQIIYIAISDNEDSDIMMESPEKKQQQQKPPEATSISSSSPISSTPQRRSSKNTKILQDITTLKLNSNNNNANMDTVNDRRVPLTSPPSFQRNSSAGLSQFRNRNSINSNSSKRWSLLSFNNEADKENLSITSKTNKRFSVGSAHSTNSTKDKSKRFSIASTSSLTDSKTKRFSITSTQSTSSGNSIKNVISKVGNVLSSVSVNSFDDTADSASTLYKNIKPGVVGEQGLKRSSTSNNFNLNLQNATSPIPMKCHSKASTSSTNININTTYHTIRDHTGNYAQSQRMPLSSSLNGSSRDSDSISMMSTSSIKTSKSRFRLSSIFSSSKKQNESTSGNDNESIRSLRGKSSFNDMRKSVLSMSTSTQSLFRLAKKESINDLNKKHHLDKTMISLPKPDTNSREKLKSRLRNSSSIISINSVLTRQTTNQTISSSQHAQQYPHPDIGHLEDHTQLAEQPPTPASQHHPIPMMTSNEYESQQLQKLVALTEYPNVLSFQDYISVAGNANNQVLIKFAEASYSEVYLLKNYETNEILKIFKIIPFGYGDFEQPTVDNVIQELKITKKLATIDGFIKINESCVVKGTYPRLLLKLWDDFNELKGSCNYRPEFDKNQKYLILDLEYGGIDLEKFKIESWEQSLEIFWSIVKTLNQAELKFKFEHRDLHWGNIVIKKNEKVKKNEEIEDVMKDLSIIEETDEEDMKSENFEGNEKLQVKLIDYTLSRLDGDLEKDEQDVIFTRLDHQDFFKGCGDYQFDIYRFMRSQIKSIQTNCFETSEEIDWSLSSFANNLYWLHYLLDKLLNHKKIQSKDEQFHKDLLYLYKSLDPRRKKLSDSKPNFVKQTGQQQQKKNKKRQIVYFQDFNSCSDVLNFGEHYGLIPWK